MRHCNYGIGYITHLGNRRRDNQDSLLVKRGSFGEHRFALLAVADGMGGLAQGDLASAAAVTALEQWWNCELAALVQPELDWAGIKSSLAVLPEAVSWQIKGFEGEPAGSTLSLAFLFDSRLLINHIGDTRIYLVRGGACRQLTRDQTWCQREIDAGNLQSARGHPMEHVLVSALGAGDSFELETSEHELEENDMLLLASDGFYGELELEGECAGWKKKDDVQQLLERASARVLSGAADDNLTAVLMRLEKRKGMR